MTDSRTFALADVLSVTTEKLLSRRHMDGIYDILSYMTGQSLFTHQLGDACDKAKPVLLEQHPQLADVCPPDGLDQPDLMAWLANAEQQYGETLEVQPLADWQHRDPIEDACDKVSAEKVWVVPLPPRDARLKAIRHSGRQGGNLPPSGGRGRQRVRLDDLTSDEYDKLYRQRDQLAAALRHVFTPGMPITAGDLEEWEQLLAEVAPND